MKEFEITEEQQKLFDKQGFLLLENALPDDLLNYWQDLSHRMEMKANKAHQKGQDMHGVCMVEDPVGPRLMRFDDVLAVDRQASIKLLACPAMMAVARQLSGRGTVPLQMDILYKQQHPHPVINWHQGAAHPRGYPYLNVGIYLDDAASGDGCLRYVSNTQDSIVDIEKLSKEHGWDIPGVVEQPAKAGDILIQDMMILHGSQPKRSGGVRRTVYVELRPYEGILETGDQSEDWANLRKQWMQLVINQADKGSWPKEWLKDYPEITQSESQIVKTIIENREPPTPAFWGIQSVETKDYPVPSDLKDW